MVAPVVSREELSDLSLACQKVWDLDGNRLEPGQHYDIDLQARVQFVQFGDSTHEKPSLWQGFLKLIPFM
jgi:hypothetical protein